MPEAPSTPSSRALDDFKTGHAINGSWILSPNVEPLSPISPCFHAPNAPNRRRGHEAGTGP